MKKLAEHLGYFFGALVFAFVLSYVPKVDAQVEKKVSTLAVDFYHDIDNKTWYTEHGNIVTDLEMDYDELTVIWETRYEGQPVILVAGRKGTICEMDYNLFWFRSNGDVELATGFGTCKAEHVTGRIESGSVILTFDGKVKQVPLW